MSTPLPYQDRYGRPLEVGQQVRAQFCIGRYGQTRQVTGELMQIGPYQSVRIKTAAGEIVDGGPGFRVVWDGDRAVALRGYHLHDDYEHGHEQWIEVLT